MVSTNILESQQHDDKVVFSEMKEFVWGLQLHKDVREAQAIRQRRADRETRHEVRVETEDYKKVVPDETIHERIVGQGLAATLKLLKDQGAFKESVEWGGRNTDKRKNKLVDVCGKDEVKEVNIERTDEYGRTLTPKEAYRRISYKFHGKGPGKAKKEKRMRQYQLEMKLKQMKKADTPSHSMERIKEAQAKLQSPFLVLSGHVKPQ